MATKLEIDQVFEEMDTLLQESEFSGEENEKLISIGLYLLKKSILDTDRMATALENIALNVEAVSWNS